MLGNLLGLKDPTKTIVANRRDRFHSCEEMKSANNTKECGGDASWSSLQMRAQPSWHLEHNLVRPQADNLSKLCSHSCLTQLRWQRWVVLSLYVCSNLLLNNRKWIQSSNSQATKYIPLLLKSSRSQVETFQGRKKHWTESISKGKSKNIPVAHSL